MLNIFFTYVLTRWFVDARDGARDVLVYYYMKDTIQEYVVFQW